MTVPPDLIGFTRRALGLSEEISLELSPLGRRGSDRVFFRLTWDNAGSVILSRYNPVRTENTFFAGIAEFLRSIGVPVPVVLAHDTSACLVIMEDLGDTDLWSLRDRPWEERRALYEKTLKVLHRLHSFPEDHFPADRVKLMEGFGPGLYRWERDYFRDHFLNGACGIILEHALAEELERELAGLAERLAMGPRCLVHRDLQSQNVMIRQGTPFFIDFQGMRFGSPYYDLGSLLCDPYVNLPKSEQDELLALYHRMCGRKPEWNAFCRHFVDASAQRLMQALGAYGFLGLTKGLGNFLEHIPAGISQMRRLLCDTGDLPLLHGLVEKAANRWRTNAP